MREVNIEERRESLKILEENRTQLVKEATDLGAAARVQLRLKQGLGWRQSFCICVVCAMLGSAEPFC